MVLEFMFADGTRLAIGSCVKDFISTLVAMEKDHGRLINVSVQATVCEFSEDSN